MRIGSPQNLLRTAGTHLFPVVVGAAVMAGGTLSAFAQDGHEGHDHSGIGPPIPLPASLAEFVVFVFSAILVLAALRKIMIHRPWSATAEERAARPDIASARRQFFGLLGGVVLGVVLIPAYLPLRERLHAPEEIDPLTSHAEHDQDDGHDDDRGHSGFVYVIAPVVLGAIGSLGAVFVPAKDD